MNDTLNKVLWFAAGAVIGVAVTRNYFKTKYECVAQEKIDSMEWAFAKLHEDNLVDGGAEEATDADLSDIAEHIIHRQGYTAPREKPAETTRKEVKGVYNPYVIAPTDFDTIDGYEAVSLNYYEDGVLADDMGNVIEDVDAMVGRDSLTHFGEYEDDSVHVRNDALKCDFEILRDLRNYSDVYQNGARPDDD